MQRAKEEKKVEVKEEKPRWYKGYNMKFLKQEVDHPDFKLVAEYEALYGEII